MKKNDVIYIVDVLAINNEFFGCKPPKERYSHHFSLSLSHFHLLHRLQYAEKLAKVLNKPCRRIPLLK